MNYKGKEGVNGCEVRIRQTIVKKEKCLLVVKICCEHATMWKNKAETTLHSKSYHT